MEFREWSNAGCGADPIDDAELVFEPEAAGAEETDASAEQVFGRFICVTLLERGKFLFGPFRRKETSVTQGNHQPGPLVHFVNGVVRLDGSGPDAVALGC